MSYLNSRPLVWGLDTDPAVRVLYEVPAKLLGLLLGGECDIALLPVIDYQRADDLTMVPASCIGADGPVYTVRLFSRVPIAKIRRLYADVESHTSVALCRMVLKHVYDVEPEFVSDAANADASLLIGDKVVCAAPPGHPYELDLAEAWKNWTGLPFVFAVWMTREGTALADVQQRLRSALAEGMRNVDRIIEMDALPRHWPVPVAREYLTKLLKFPIDLGERSAQRRAIELFHQRAFEMRLTTRCRPIRVCSALAECEAGGCKGRPV